MSAIGPLALVAVIYIIIGTTIGYVIRELFYVPRNFWQGVVVANGLSNWGNLRESLTYCLVTVFSLNISAQFTATAVVVTVAAHSPFDPDTDPGLGVSYVSIFIVVRPSLLDLPQDPSLSSPHVDIPNCVLDMWSCRLARVGLRTRRAPRRRSRNTSQMEPETDRLLDLSPRPAQARSTLSLSYQIGLTRHSAR